MIPKIEKHKSFVILKLTIGFCFLLFLSGCKTRTEVVSTRNETSNQTINTSEALIWQKYVGKTKRLDIPLLFDYSYAGYQLGTKGIPESFEALKVFDVTDYGAIPNDTLSDQKAIQKAIDAAEQNGGGIVFFPPGDYWVNVRPEKAYPIVIKSSNIILKGSGWQNGGTTIHMKDHMLQDFPEQPEWEVSYMFRFQPETIRQPATTLVKDAVEGDFSIEVQSVEPFKNAQYVQLEMPYNLSAVKEALQDRPIRPHWEKVLEQGVTYLEIHEIEKIDGHTIVLKDPLVNPLKVAYNWQVRPFYPLENVGVEDISFKANFQDDFIHHKDFLHDNAWSMIAMDRVAQAWVRRCRFQNITGAVSLSHSYASSILMLLVDGNAGHKLTNVTQSSRVLTGLINDATNGGQFHGAAMSHKTSGSVIWRVNTPKQGWDSHADIPKNNLVDRYEAAKMTNHGGYHKNEPHHLEGLTLWNYKRVGDTVSGYDFWNMTGKRPDDMYWGFSVVNPYVVGLHGSLTTLNTSSVGYLESLGAAVKPESLYEAQLEYRLKTRPNWIDHCLGQWQAMQDQWIKIIN